MAHVCERLGVSERRACRVLGQARSTQRHVPRRRDDEAALTADIVALAREYGRYGYRRVAPPPPRRNGDTPPSPPFPMCYGAEFCAKAVREWLGRLDVGTLYIELGSPWENGYCESFNGKLRDDLLNGEIFYTLLEAEVLIDRWRQHCNSYRPHSALGYRPPAPEAIDPVSAGLATLRYASPPDASSVLLH